MTAQRSLPLTILNIITGVALVIFLYMALIWAPPAANLQGAEQAAQRIFYCRQPTRQYALPHLKRFHLAPLRIEGVSDRIDQFGKFSYPVDEA